MGPIERGLDLWRIGDDLVLGSIQIRAINRILCSALLRQAAMNIDDGFAVGCKAGRVGKDFGAGLKHIFRGTARRVLNPNTAITRRIYKFSRQLWRRRRRSLQQGRADWRTFDCRGRAHKRISRRCIRGCGSRGTGRAYKNKYE
jgi:hypothetical protein